MHGHSQVAYLGLAAEVRCDTPRNAARAAVVVRAEDETCCVRR